MREARCVAGRAVAPPGGFTLIELLTVMAVIVFLAGLLFPVLAQARDLARRSACLSHLRQIGQAHRLYLEDWEERFPAWMQEGPPRRWPYGSRCYWTELLQPYLRSQPVLRDFGATWAGTPEEGVRLADYALLTWGPGGEGTPQSPYFRWADPLLVSSAVRRPAETILFCDGFTTTEITHGLVLRHQGGLNAACLDGHARWLPPAELRRVDTDGHGFYWRHYAAADR
jgi:prepilin-type N-terminal cleavage/methylation domain-containing protein/prepilin-type processing-associated H-X9-DG protein